MNYYLLKVTRKHLFKITADASELQENFGEMFPLHNDVFSRFQSSITL